MTRWRVIRALPQGFAWSPPQPRDLDATPGPLRARGSGRHMVSGKGGLDLLFGNRRDVRTKWEAESSDGGLDCLLAPLSNSFGEFSTIWCCSLTTFISFLLYIALFVETNTPFKTISCLLCFILVVYLGKPYNRLQFRRAQPHSPIPGPKSRLRPGRLATLASRKRPFISAADAGDPDVLPPPTRRVVESVLGPDLLVAHTPPPCRPRQRHEAQRAWEYHLPSTPAPTLGSHPTRYGQQPLEEAIPLKKLSSTTSTHIVWPLNGCHAGGGGRHDDFQRGIHYLVGQPDQGFLSHCERIRLCTDRATAAASH